MKRLLSILLWISLATSAFAQIKLVQNVAIDVAVGPFVDTTGAAVNVTLTQADVRLKKNSGAWAQKTQASSCTQEENGWQECSLDTTDTNTTGTLILAVNESGALPVWIYFEVIPQASYDPLVAGNVANVSDIFAEPVPGSYSAGQVGYVLGTNLRYLAAGTADSGSTTTVVDTERTEGDTDYFKGDLIVFTSGTLAGQSREITAFNAATDTITFSPAVTQAVSTHTYEIWPAGGWIRPTIAGRTLDVATGGEAGIDLDNTVGTLNSTEIPNLDAAISSRLAPTVPGRTLGVTTGGQAGVDLSNVNGTLDAAEIGGDAISATQLSATASAEIADQVWDEILSGHLGAGSTGAALNSASSAGDPWNTALPGAYGAGTAGRMISDMEVGSSGTAQAGANTSITLAAGASATTDFYKDKRVLLVTGTGAGQSAIITAYNGGTKVATIFCEGSATGAWFTNPTGSTTYLIVARNRQ